MKQSALRGKLETRKFAEIEGISQKQRRRIEALENEVKFLRQSCSKGDSSGSNKGNKGKGKSKGGKKGKFNKRMPNMPAPLQGKAWETADGTPICFSFNMPGVCNKAEPGKMCPHGLHVCAEWDCFEPHSLQEHRGKPWV